MLLHAGRRHASVRPPGGPAAPSRDAARSRIPMRGCAWGDGVVAESPARGPGTGPDPARAEWQGRSRPRRPCRDGEGVRERHGARVGACTGAVGTAVRPRAHAARDGTAARTPLGPRAPRRRYGRGACATHRPRPRHRPPSAGRTYADVRVVRRREESIDVKTGRLDGVSRTRARASASASSSTARGASPASHRLTAGGGRPRRRRRPSGSPAASATALRHPVVLDDRPPRPRALRDAGRGGPVRDPARARRSRDLLAADEAMRARQGDRLHRLASYGAQREEKTFAATDGTLHRAGDHPRRRRDRGQRRRRRRAPAPELPDAGWRLAGRRLRVHPRARPRRARAERLASEAVELLTAPQLPPGRRTIVLDPSPALPPGPRELRPPDRARPRLRHRGQLRRDELPDHRQARGGLPLRHPSSSTSSPTPPRPAGWAPSAGTTRACAAQAVPLVRAGDLRRLPLSRARRRRGSGVASGGAMRADGWNRIPLIRMTNINLLPKPGMSLDDIVADTDDGLFLASNRSWSIDDRRLNFQFATEMCLRDQGRQARAALPERDLHRDHPRVLGLLRRGRRRVAAT